MSQLKMSFFYVIGDEVTYDIKKGIGKSQYLKTQGLRGYHDEYGT